MNGAASRPEWREGAESPTLASGRRDLRAETWRSPRGDVGWPRPGPRASGPGLVPRNPSAGHGAAVAKRPRVAPFVYARRRPEQTTLYAVVRDNVETLYAAMAESGAELPRFVRAELEGYLDCGLLCRGFAHLKCEGCSEPRLAHVLVQKPRILPVVAGPPDGGDGGESDGERAARGAAAAVIDAFLEAALDG